jgi:transposase
MTPVMPYVKVSTSKSGAWTVQLATKNYGKSVILRHIGSAHNPAELKRLKDIARQELERPALGQLDLFTTRLDLDRVRVTAHKPEYLERIIKHYYQTMGFNELGPALLFDLVLMRIYQPCSKLRSLRILETQFGRSYSFQTAYRLLDKIAEDKHSSKNRLEQKLYAAHTTHYKTPLTVVLYDVTTLYFESARDGDEYKLPGYSKDGKHKDPQILVGLLTNLSGFPLAYETFAGNTFEGHTLLVALQNWQTQFSSSKLRVIADAGMLSRLNVEKLTAAGFDFIVGARLKSIPASLTKKLLKLKRQDGIIHELKHNDHRLVVHYSAKRAKKDLNTVDKAIKKAEAIIDGTQSLKRRSKFVQTSSSTGKTTDQTLSLNQLAIDQDRVLAGLKGYITNLKEVDAEEIISQYKELIHVEQSFRMSKHDLRARPVFHHKEDSIKAHLFIVVMALAIGRLLEKHSAQSIQKTVEQLGNALSYTLEDTATGATRVQHPRLEELNLQEVLASLLLPIEREETGGLIG